MEEDLTQPCKDPSFIPSTYPPPSITPSFAFSSITDDPDYQATQLNNDANRLANGNSGLTDEDAADIVCIIHPDSEIARIACSENNQWNPKNTISLDGNVSHIPSEGLFPCDLAVRLSTKLKDISLGWVFGRGHERCDFILRAGSIKVSNQHFRIYLNEHAILMVEDMSTNGITVDGTLLRYKRKDEGVPHRQTIENGSLLGIAVSSIREENFHFIIRIPQRSDEAQEAYEKNVVHYMARLQEDKVRRDIALGRNRHPLNLFPNAANRGASSSSMVRKRREWKGGSKYNKIDVIGKGAFAVVYRVTDKRSGTPFAAKELEKKKFLKNGVQKIDTEMKIMSKIHHENVVRFIECVDWDEYLYLIMEFVPEGDLTGLVTQCHHLPEPVVKTITRQLLSALKCLHALNVTHRDIKPDNILCQSRNPIHVKLTDFGLSKMIDTNETFLRTFCGTLLYCAPEVYNEYPQYGPIGQRTNRRTVSQVTQRYDHAVDIWSLAGVLFYSLCGSPPFPVDGTTHYVQLLQKIMTKPLDISPLTRIGISEAGTSFVVKMLHIEPHSRATIEELEKMRWLTGENPNPDETEDEDVEKLELPASQLSLVDIPESEEEDEDGEFGADAINFQPREIPSSFSTNDSVDGKSLELPSSIPSDLGANTSSAENILAQESYEVIRNPTNNVRLFGEVDVNSSALGSSGTVPLNTVDLPTPVQHIKGNIPRLFSKQNSTHPAAKFKTRHEAVSAMPKTPPPPPPQIRSSVATPAMRQVETGVNPNPSSLMGTVSQLGHLQMNSPSISPTVISAPRLSPSTYTQACNVSLRRPRENSNVWHPNDLPPQKRHKSTRTIDLMIPPETFWDPRDPSTHHKNYPPMLASDYHRFVKLAESKGEKFQHGCTTFDHAMVSFRSFSKTPSMDTSASFRAQSEPLVEGPQQSHARLARDERRLSDDASVQQSIASRDSVSISDNTFLPRVTPESGPLTVKTGMTKENAEVIPTIEATTEGTSAINQEIVSSAGNDFQVPKRVLARFSATSDSYVPTIAFNVTDPFTSWGRGYGNTIRYTTRDDVRVGVPRYAFKLLLFRNDFYPSDGNYTEEWNNNRGDEEGFRYLISTKASAGLAINGVKLPSHNANEPMSASKYWGEIRNGDIITISVASSLVLKLKFECFWGMGKYVRKASKFFLYKELDHIAKVDETCTMLETAAIQKRDVHEVEQKKLAQEIKRQRTESVGL